MDWQDIVHRDPFLAGAIVARGHEAWDKIMPEQVADSVHLVGEAREKFLAGWQFEMEERKRERKERMMREYDAMGKGYEKGDPAR